MQNKLVNIAGASESRSALVISRLIKREGQTLIITANETRARELADDLAFFSQRQIHVMPDPGDIFLRYTARSNERMMERLRVLKELRTHSDAVVICPASAAVRKMMPKDGFSRDSFQLKIGDEQNPEHICSKLVSMGYERSTIVQGRGQFASRGGIIDIYTADGENPYRVEFFGDEIDSLRNFDADTQRSLENMEQITIYPAEELVADGDVFQQAINRVRERYDQQTEALLMKREQDYEEAIRRLAERRDELIFYMENRTNIQLLENYVNYFFDEPDTIFDYAENCEVIIDDAVRVGESLDLRETELKEDFKVLLARGQVVPSDATLITGWKQLLQQCRKNDTWMITPFSSKIKGVDEFTDLKKAEAIQVMGSNGNLQVFEKQLREYLEKDFKVIIAASTVDRQKSLYDFLESRGLEEKITVITGMLSSGVQLNEEKLVYISDNDIFSGKKKSSGRRKKRKKDKRQPFSDMRKGDFVVHENHGIGKFIGIEPMEVNGEEKDYLRIKYAGTDMLYVPVEQMDIVQKYIGNEGTAPKLSKLSGNEWKVTKAKARAAIEEMADELIELYADREAKKGYAFSEDSEWQQDFEDSFPYELTDDQRISTEEIKKDMEKPVSMDRLLCGDVGFGKTEVAARAIFKCLADGKQAAVLVPTTLLANQHYNTLKDRFERFPFKVEMMSRFRTAAQQKEIAEKLKEGQIDLVIGTHRILSGDIEYKDLGLLVVDEEQKFGVAHKEKIKQIKNNVDVLTLSATPIPRTLNMSLTGIRDMSVLEEPPEERYPVQTYVIEEEDGILREIIKREIDRGGQVYVVYNRVRGINRIADHIGELVPEASVITGHGQMQEHELSKVMMDFVEGRYNVLVATTIIESGIDIKNANTMIVIDADKYGLSQLYQLKGRVGRSNRVAYAYFTYRKNQVLSQVAEKRLKAIREFTEFGSGFKVAMRDLEIRGAGNLLGKEQSGHMMSIGYELYCKLVEDAVRRKANSEPVQQESEEETSIELQVNANIPKWYIAEEMLKLQMYKKIAQIREPEDLEETVDEMTDRFGDIPKETMNLIRLSLIRSLADRLGVTVINEKAGKIYVYFGEKNGLTGFGIMNVTAEFERDVFFHGGAKSYMSLDVKPKKRMEKLARLLDILYENRLK